MKLFSKIKKVILKFFSIHEWGSWSDPLQDYSGTLYQYRRCKKCKAIKRRRLFWQNAINGDKIVKALNGDHDED